MEKETHLKEQTMVEHHHQRLIDGLWKPVTVTLMKDVDDAELDNMLRDKEELNKPHELSD